MAIYFTSSATIAGGSAPSDANDGRDPIGFNLSGATYDDTGNGEGEHHISSTGAFTSYTHSTGDQIYLDAGAGVTTGLYTIASKVDADAILLSSSAGSDSTSDVGSSDGPNATIQASIDACTVAGDQAHICATGTYTPTVRTDIDWGNATRGSEKRLKGVAARGLDDGTQVTVSGSSLGASTDLFIFTNGSSDYAVMENMRITAATRHGIYHDEVTTLISLVNVRVDNCTTNGVHFARSNAQGLIIVNSEFDNNGGDGIGTNAAGQAHINATCCSFHDNTGNGCESKDQPAIWVDCLFFKNGGKGLVVEYDSNMLSMFAILGCTFQGNTGDNIDIATDVSLLIAKNNTSSGSGGYGWNFNGGDPETICLYFDYNHTHNNTSGASDVTLPGENNITGDPLFESTTGGSEDYEPGSSSPLIGAGLPGVIQSGAGGTGYRDIGALQREMAAGGGGTTGRQGLHPIESGAV